MRITMTWIKNISVAIQSNFITKRGKLARYLSFGMLLLSLIVGAGYRGIVLKEYYKIWDGFGVFLSLASHFHKTPGLYSHEESLYIDKNPEGYIYTRGKSDFKPTGTIENELGWAFILSLILPERAQGVQSLARTVIYYQVILDMAVIILLFWIGKELVGWMGAILAAYLYSIFKMPMVVASWVVYYYWTTPFSVLSLFFWFVLYRPQSQSMKKKCIYFFFYGVLIGFATFVRLYFLCLPLFLSPLLFMQEKSVKKGLILLMIIFVGQSLFLIPQIALNKIHQGVYALSTRGTWHTVIQGLGARPNPWGIKDSQDLTCVDWVIKRGGPDLNQQGIRAYDRFCKQEVLRLFKERPDVFIHNAFINIKDGLTISPHYFHFFGLSDTIVGHEALSRTFPWLVLGTLFILFFICREHFWMMLVVVLHGIYLLLVILPIFPNYIPFIAGYIPVFVLLFAVALAVHCKLIFAIIEAGLRCWVNAQGIKVFPKVLAQCYREAL